MRKLLIRNCEYAKNPVDEKSLHCDVYVLLDDNDELLFYENIFLADISSTYEKNTAKGYASDLLSFVKMASNLGGWSAITQRQLTGYLHGELFQRRKYKKPTMQHHINTLKHFYNWLSKKGFYNESNNFDWSFEHLYEIHPLDHTAYHASHHSFHSLYIDQNIFFNQLLPGVKSKNSFIRKRDQVVLRLGYECGTRAHEVLKLKAKTVRREILRSKESNDGLWAVTKIRIKGKGAKNRDLLIPPSLCEFIWNYLVRYRNTINNCRGRLICTEKGSNLKDEKHASTVFKETCLNIKLVRFHKQGYHRLRKSFGTNLCQECIDNGDDPWVLLPRRLGHSNIETTKKYIQFDALRNNRSSTLNDLKMLDNKYRAIYGD